MRLIDADALIGPIKLQEESYRRCGAIERAEAYANCLWEIEQAQTVGGWISVKDRLPEVGDTVLFTGMSSYGTWFSTKRGWFDGTFWKRDEGETVYSSTPVTHWMPLPEPPEEENDD